MNIKNNLFLMGLGFMLLMVFHVLNVGIAYAADTTYYISSNKIFPEGGYGEVTVLCPKGLQVTGGGFILDENIIVAKSIPYYKTIQGAIREGWQVDAYEAKSDGNDNIIKAYVVCIP